MLASVRAVIAAAVLAATAAPSLAQELTLRVADFYPVGHKTPEYATKFWMEEVTRLTGGKVKFEYYPAEQLGKAKDLMSLAVSGVTDVAGFGTSYVSEKMPLSAVAELPGGASTSCGGTLAYWKLATSGPLHDAEYAPNGVRLLFVVVNPPFQLYLTRDSLASAADIAGLKIRTTGGAQDATIRQLKGVPVRMAGPEIYEALSRGTMDGILFPVTSLFSYELQKLVKVGTFDQNFGSGVLPYAISETRWQSLPEDVRKAMLEAGEAATRRACGLIDKDAEPVMAKLKEAGVNLVSLGAEAEAEIQKELAVVSGEWAANLDKAGKPGTPILEAFRQALAGQ